MTRLSSSSGTSQCTAHGTLLLTSPVDLEDLERERAAASKLVETRPAAVVRDCTFCSSEQRAFEGRLETGGCICAHLSVASEDATPILLKVLSGITGCGHKAQ
jgi:hypothetical protein